MEQVKRRKLNIGSIIEYELEVNDSEAVVGNDMDYGKNQTDGGGYDETEHDDEVNDNADADVVDEDEGDEDAIGDEYEKLRGLLQTWGITSFFHTLHSHGINYGNLHLLEESDYAMLVEGDGSQLGNMIVFRTFHRQWLKSVIKQKSIVDLKLILKEGGDSATEIMEYFEANSILTDTLREKLVSIIIKAKRVLTRPMMDDIAHQICTIFSGESKRMYYEKKDNKAPTGMLYVRYIESRRTKQSIARSELPVPAEEDREDLLTDDMRQSIDFVNDKSKFTDLHLTEMLFEHWQASFSYRYSKKYSAAEALNAWPVLQENDAMAMILDDFLTKFGSQTSNSMKTKWSDFIFKNQTVLADGIKNAKMRKELLQAQSENDVNVRDRKTLMAFHNLSYVVPAKVTIKNQTWTPTIPDSQTAFLKVVKNKKAIAIEMNRQNSLSEVRGVSYHPIIIEVSNATESNYFVAVCQTVYECPSLIEAVDLAFKFFVIFDIPFPPQCKKVWQLLNEVFYKIDLPQKPNFKILSILNSFQM